jgi:hypothetical protein
LWIELIKSICPKARPAPPASEADLVSLKAALGVGIPEELRGLWSESNGIEDEYGDGIFSISETVKVNLEMRRRFARSDLYMPFDNLFFFGRVGNGA